jgi:glutathione S-transferase
MLGAMSFEYLSVEEARARPGLRMVVVGKVPSPWGEAAKNIFHMKGIDFAAVRLVYDNEALKHWAGQLSGPVAIFNDEPPRANWEDILMLAERLADTPGLVPVKQRHEVQALCGKFCGKGGLGWHRRLQLVHGGLTGTGGFGERVAAYLGGKYGYDPAHAESDAAAVHRLLGEFAGILRAQRDAGRHYYLGELSAVDVYSATFMALLKPLPQEQCDMHPSIRAALESLDEPTARALDPILLEHRDMMYSRHFPLPLSL